MEARHIFLTGPPGVGKSTLVHRVLQRLQETSGIQPLGGFWTAEVRDARGERAGFDVHTLGGGGSSSGTAARQHAPQQGPLARIAPPGQNPRGAMVGKYKVDLPSFERLALPHLRDTGDAGLLVIDEVGRMELLSRAFFPAVRAVLDSPRLTVLGTIPCPKPDGGQLREVSELSSRPDVQVVVVSRANRDSLVDSLAQQLAALLARTTQQQQQQQQ